MSTIDAKIADYEQEKEEHKAKITKIENGKGLYSELSNKEKLNAIKSENDIILACEARILQLGNQQMPGKWMILLIFCFILLTCLPTICFNPPLGVNRFQRQEPKVNRFLFILLDYSGPIIFFFVFTSLSLVAVVF